VAGVVRVVLGRRCVGRRASGVAAAWVLRRGVLPPRLVAGLVMPRLRPIGSGRAVCRAVMACHAVATAHLPKA
jgi:hypothetical protein